jgi:hypothetical protein
MEDQHLCAPLGFRLGWKLPGEPEKEESQKQREKD